MAFGKAPDPKPLKVTPFIEDQLWKANVRSEEVASAAWKTKWGWILTEYDKLHEELDEVSKNSVMLSQIKDEKKEVETRTIKPFPDSVAHDCGWLSSRKEFKLEKYGPDYYKGMPFVSLSS